MDAALETADVDVPRKRRRSRMIRAILAGGLVLGVGTAVTLAAWNDSEFVTSTFGSGAFGLQGAIADSATPTNFSDHATQGTAANIATYSLDAANLSPNSTTTAPYAVRLKPGTTLDGTVNVYVTSATGTIIPNLSWSIYPQSAWGCSTLTGAVASQTTTASGVTSTGSFGVVKGTPVSAAGVVRNLCIAVTTSGSLGEGQTGTIVWEFRAVSSS